jgi:FlaA1/EpsC-like NDP-sugar epimerase
MRPSLKSALAMAAASVALLCAGAASATTFYLLDLEADESGLTVTEPAAFTDPSPGHRRGSLIDIDVFGSVDITEIELDCDARKVMVISEKLYRSSGELVVDKTGQNQTGWRDFPTNSQMEIDRQLICGWPQSRDADLELHGADYWSLVKSLIGSLSIPEGFFDD